MEQDMSAPSRRMSLTIGNLLTFLGMVAVAISVYYTGAGQRDRDISALQTDMANAKAAVAQIRSDLSAAHAEQTTASQTIAASIDRIRDQITEIKVLVAKSAPR